MQPEAMQWSDIKWPYYFPVFGLSLGLLFLVELAAKSLLPHLEDRPGIIVFDPVLNWLPVVDLSGPIFWVLYPVGALGFALAARQPRDLLVTILAYAFMHFFRFVCICCVPLYAPEQLIVLRDPLVDAFIYEGFFLKRDLFYSGHFASMFLLYLIFSAEPVRWFFLLAAAFIGLGVMLQHIHYSYDVLGAIPFCYFSVHCACKCANGIICKCANFLMCE
jgi:hypothetical protein